MEAEHVGVHHTQINSNFNAPCDGKSKLVSWSVSEHSLSEWQLHMHFVQSPNMYHLLTDPPQLWLCPLIKQHTQCVICSLTLPPTLTYQITAQITAKIMVMCDGRSKLMCG